MPDEVVNGNLLVTGAVTTVGSTQCNSTLYVNSFSRLGPCTVAGTLTASGPATFASDLSVGSWASVGGGLAVQGDTSLAGSLQVSGTCTFGTTNMYLPVIRMETAAPPLNLTVAQSGAMVVLVTGTGGNVVLPATPPAGTLFRFTTYYADVYHVTASGGDLLRFSNTSGVSFPGVLTAISNSPRATLGLVYDGGGSWFGIEAAYGWAD